MTFNGFAFNSCCFNGVVAIVSCTIDCVEKALPYRLANDAGLYALVGNRVYQGYRPQCTPPYANLPCIVIEWQERTPDELLDGPSGLNTQLFTVKILSRTEGEIDAIIEALRQCLDGYSGTVGTIKFLDTWEDNDATDYERIGDGSDGATVETDNAYGTMFYVPPEN